MTADPLIGDAVSEDRERLMREVADKLLRAILLRTSWTDLKRHDGIVAAGPAWPWYVTEQIQRLKDAGIAWEEYT